MATENILSLIIAERDKLNRAIEALGSPVKRWGRPPKNSAPTAVAVSPMVAPAPVRKRKRRSAAARKAHSERMRAYWAARRKKQAKG